jgi:CheY-like chemotaxis protein
MMMVAKPDPAVVIVTEDEPLIRTFAADILTDAGFTVVEASHADDALTILNSRAVDVLFTDVQMPGFMNGLELARHVRRRWPRIVVLVASGNAPPTPSDMPDGSRFLPKPYSYSQLLAGVQELVAAK